MIDVSKLKLRFIFDVNEKYGTLHLEYNGRTASRMEFEIKPKFKVTTISASEMLFDYLCLDFTNTETGIDDLFNHELVKEAYERYVGEKYKMLTMYR